MTKVDKTDLRLLELLRMDARQPVSRLAKATSLPRSTVAYRIRALEEAGLITGYTVRVNHAALGEPETAFVMIQLGSMPIRKTEEFASQLAKMPGVEEVYVTAGEWDLIAKIRGADNRALFHMVQGLHLQSWNGRSATLMTFKPIKEPV